MTPRERLLTALARGVPDRVPIMGMAIDWKVVRDLSLTRRYTDVWGVKKRLFHKLMPSTTDHPVQSLADLRSHRPPDPRRDPLLGAIRRTVRPFRGHRAVVLIAQAEFAAAWNLCGMERLLTSYLLELDFTRALNRLAQDHHLELHRPAIGAGCDLIILSDDYAHKSGPLMSPAQLHEFVLSGLAAVKRRYGSRVCVMGNVDVILLCRGSTADVQGVSGDLLHVVSAGGGHLLSSGNSISSAVRPENSHAMVSTARAWSEEPRSSTNTLAMRRPTCTSGDARSFFPRLGSCWPWPAA